MILKYQRTNRPTLTLWTKAIFHLWEVWVGDQISISRITTGKWLSGCHWLEKRPEASFLSELMKGCWTIKSKYNMKTLRVADAAFTSYCTDCLNYEQLNCPAPSCKSELKIQDISDSDNLNCKDTLVKSFVDRKCIHDYFHGQSIILSMF